MSFSRPRLSPPLIALVFGLSLACTNVDKGQNSSPNEVEEDFPMGNWDAWQDLSPLVEQAKLNLGKEQHNAFSRAQNFLRKGEVPKADKELSTPTHGMASLWRSVARADLAALHFSVCIRGVAWRLEKLTPDTPPRSFDFSPDRRIGENDVSVEAMLTNLDAVLKKSPPDSTLGIQARIARARVTALASQCAANSEVAKQANEVLRIDLATLAASRQLTPDLAYVWAGIQLSEFSASASKPFLLLAKKGGFDGPHVDYLLAVALLDEGRYEEADKLAASCVKSFDGKSEGEKEQLAQSLFLRGEIAHQSKKTAEAIGYYSQALRTKSDHLPSLVATLKMKAQSQDAQAAREWMHQRWSSFFGKDPLSPELSEGLVAKLDTFVGMASDDLRVTEILRDSLLEKIDLDEDPIRRGLRYFYAATLDVRLGDLSSAQGHALTAESEFEEKAEVTPPVDVRLFLQRVRELDS